MAVDIIIGDHSWTQINNFIKWKKLVGNLFCATVNKIQNRSSLSVNLLLTNNTNIKELNHKYRGKNEATNVLSFPQYSADELFQEIGDLHLGDISMAFEKIMQESKEYNINFFDRCSHLFVHGVLHLLGLDHQDDVQASKMENIEIKVLSLFKIDNPYVIGGI